jgi:hypothetical protein
VVSDAMDCAGVHPPLHQAAAPDPHHRPLDRLHGPGAYPTESYKYWFTNICNYKYL